MKIQVNAGTLVFLLKVEHERGTGMSDNAVIHGLGINPKWLRQARMVARFPLEARMVIEKDWDKPEAPSFSPMDIFALDQALGRGTEAFWQRWKEMTE